MALQRAFGLAMSSLSTLVLVFLTGFRYFSYQGATQLSSRGWVDPVPDLILPEKFLEYSREPNPGSLGWQLDVLTTIPKMYILTNIYNDCNIQQSLLKVELHGADAQPM